MSLKKLRLEKGWSQEHLAQTSGLSLRTIQRIESGRRPSLDSANCLAAIFEINVNTLLEEQTMTHDNKTISNDFTQDTNEHSMSAEEREAVEYVKNIKAMRLSFLFFIIVIPCLYLLNIKTTPDAIWVQWAAVPWLFSFLLHWVVIKVLFGAVNTEWEQREVNKRLNRRR